MPCVSCRASCSFFIYIYFFTADTPFCVSTVLCVYHGISHQQNAFSSLPIFISSYDGQVYFCLCRQTYQNLLYKHLQLGFVRNGGNLSVLVEFNLAMSTVCSTRQPLDSTQHLVANHIGGFESLSQQLLVRNSIHALRAFWRPKPETLICHRLSVFDSLSAVKRCCSD